MAGSMTDVAYELLGKKRKEVTFSKLWSEVSSTLGFTPAQAETKIAKFYSELMLDKRFVSLGDNTWNLRTRYKYDDIKIEIEEIETEEESEEVEELEEIIEEAY